MHPSLPGPRPHATLLGVPVAGFDTLSSHEALRACGGLSDDVRAWSRWNPAVGRRYTVGIEEEIMLLDSLDHALAQSSDAVLAELSSSRELAHHAGPETHAGVVELVTGIHCIAAAACGELAALRAKMAIELRRLGLVAACAGMHPLARAAEMRLSSAERYRRLGDAMRSVALREPTMALHVHIGIPDPDDAVRVLNTLREHTGLLIAMAGNSPFAQGRDTGFASARTMTFGMFPRTGSPRAFPGYQAYLDAVAPLVESGALPDLTHLWWDIRLQPALGTVEVRVMDAQITLGETAALVALVQSLARSALEDPVEQPESASEIVEENRFLAARDGPDARLIDPRRKRLVPVRTLLSELLSACRPHAAALGCARELERLPRLAGRGGAARQRAWFRAGGDLNAVLLGLVSRFAPWGGRSSGARA